LFGTHGHDIRAALRAKLSDEQLAELLGGIWAVRDDRYSEIRSEATVRQPKVEMSAIGG
jgi:cyclic pyranopterin phosphate synthase